jgi:hypothetical protein
LAHIQRDIAICTVAFCVVVIFRGHRVLLFRAL